MQTHLSSNNNILPILARPNTPELPPLSREDKLRQLDGPVLVQVEHPQCVLRVLSECPGGRDEGFERGGREEEELCGRGGGVLGLRSGGGRGDERGLGDEGRWEGGGCVGGGGGDVRVGEDGEEFVDYVDVGFYWSEEGRGGGRDQ